MSTIRTNEVRMLDDLGKSNFTFDSVQDMKASTQLKVGQKVRTLGYYEPDDGGGNDYEIVAAGTGTDDGGSFIDLVGSGLQAKGLFLDSVVKFSQFGVLPAGDAHKINALLQFASNNPNLSRVEFVGEYLVEKTTDSSCVRIPSNIDLVGFGEERSCLRLADNVNDAAVIRPVVGAKNINLVNFKIDGNRNGQSNPTGDLLGYCGSPDTNNIKMLGIRVVNTHARAIMTSRSLGANATRSSNITLLACRVEGFGTKGIQVSGTDTAEVIGCTSFSSNADSSGIEVSASSNVKVSSCTSIDGSAGMRCIRVVNGCDQVTVVGNTTTGGYRSLFCSDSTSVKFIANSCKNADDGMFIEHSDADDNGYSIRDVQIKDNDFININGDGVLVSINSSTNGLSIDNLTISGNNFVGGDFGIRLLEGAGHIDARQFDNTFIDVVNHLSGRFSPSSIKRASGFISLSTGSLSNNSAVSFDLPDEKGGFFVLNVPTVPQWNAAFSYRGQTSSSRIDQAWNITPSSIASQTGQLSGSTGDVGYLTCSVHTDGKIYIENRTGETRRVSLTFLNSSET